MTILLAILGNQSRERIEWVYFWFETLIGTIEPNDSFLRVPRSVQIRILGALREDTVHGFETPPDASVLQGISVLRDGVVRHENSIAQIPSPHIFIFWSEILTEIAMHSLFYAFIMAKYLNFSSPRKVPWISLHSCCTELAGLSLDAFPSVTLPADFDFLQNANLIIATAPFETSHPFTRSESLPSHSDDFHGVYVKGNVASPWNYRMRHVISKGNSLIASKYMQ
jgi:hypothetical protein